MSNSFPGGPGQGAPGYLGAPGFVPDYGAQARYAMGGGGMPPPYGGMGAPGMYGVPPGVGGVPGGYGGPGLGGDGGGYEVEAAALAQGLDGGLVLGQQQMMAGALGGQYGAPYGAPQQQRGGGPGYGYGYGAPPLRGQQQAMQSLHMGGGQPMPGGQHGLGGPGGGYGGGPGGYGGGSGGGRGRPGRGGGMPPNDHRQQHPQQQQQQQQHPQQHPQQQQQRRKKVQRGLEENVKRTVYISYIDQQVTEESLANFFADCGTVMDCRICGDPNSAMRFAFIEFLQEAGAQEALNKTGCTLGSSQLRVLPSKTAIVPVNKELMPRSHEELERCSRTVYVANIDKKVEREDVRSFFEQLCGKVNKIRLLGDLAHSTRIAFIEFVQAEAAMAALNCSGALLGSLPLRVSPSKTPVRGDREDKESRQQRRQQQQQQQAGGEQTSEGEAAAADGEAAAAEADASAAVAEAATAGEGGDDGEGQAPGAEGGESAVEGEGPAAATTGGGEDEAPGAPVVAEAEPPSPAAAAGAEAAAEGAGDAPEGAADAPPEGDEELGAGAAAAEAQAAA